MNLRSHATSRPVLRFVGDSLPTAAPPVGRSRADQLDGRDALGRVRRENHAAALRFDLDPNDPRWVLALRTRADLQGAALPADRRERLLNLAHQLGLRPFDANLIIAIVQDEARTGGAAGTLADRLRIVPAGRCAPAAGDQLPDAASVSDESSKAWLIPLILSLLLGAGGVLWLLRWLDAG